MSNRSVGDFGEDLAGERLEKEGYRILARNWQCRWGEIDLIARRGTEIVFVEVKTRRSGRYGLPEEALTRAKKKALVLTAAQYLGENLHAVDWRIDCIAIETDRSGRPLRVEHFENIVEGEFDTWV